MKPIIIFLLFENHTLPIMFKIPGLDREWLYVIAILTICADQVGSSGNVLAKLWRVVDDNDRLLAGSYLTLRQARPRSPQNF